MTRRLAVLAPSMSIAVAGLVAPFTVNAATAPDPTIVVAGESIAMTQIVDTSGALTITVPASWSQIDLTPASPTQGRLVASPDLATFSPGRTIPEDYTVPGLLILGTEPIPFDPAQAASFLPFDGCTEGATVAYADGTFTGSVLFHDACGGTAARVAVLAANRDDGTAGITVVVLQTTPEDVELAAIFDGLDGDPGNCVDGDALCSPTPATTV